MARVLIVDDELSIRTSLGLFAKNDGHEVSLATDVAEALALLDKESFDVVVSDIILPRKTGVALLADIRETHPDIQVILITGEPEVGTASEAVRRGAFDYLSKPVSRGDFSSVLARATAKKVLIDKNHALEEEAQRYREHLEELVHERTKNLQDLAARYRMLFNSIADPVFVFAEEGKQFLDCNQATVDRYGYSLEELRSMHPIDLHPPEEAEVVAANFASNEASLHPYTHVTKAGERISVEIHSASIDYQGANAWISIARDITRRATAESKARRLLEQQTLINDLALELGALSDIERVYDVVHRQLSSLMDATSLIISFFDEKEQLLRAGYALFQGQPFDVSELPPIPLEKAGRGTQSEVIRTGKPLYLPDYRKARETGTTEYTVDNEGAVADGPPPEDAEDITRSAVFVPLKLRGRTTGVMQVQSYRLDAYTESDIALLGGIANVAAVAIENSRLIADIRDALEGTIGIVGSAIEVRDPYTAGHQRRVAELVGAIAEELELPPETQEALRVAALLHDIGKMSIPSEILSKPSKLSNMEFDLIKCHPEVAFKLLEPICFPWPVADIVLQHHERLDGSGYPNGLKENDIMLEARIIAVADVVEAMASHRPYRPSLGIKAALHEIDTRKGDVYDLTVVNACIKLFGEKAFAFSE